MGPFSLCTPVMNLSAHISVGVGVGVGVSRVSLGNDVVDSNQVIHGQLTI